MRHYHVYINNVSDLNTIFPADSGGHLKLKGDKQRQ